MVQTFLPPRGWEVDDEHDVPSSLALLSLASAAYYSMNQADFSGQTARAAAVPVPDFVYVCVFVVCGRERDISKRVHSAYDDRTGMPCRHLSVLPFPILTKCRPLSGKFGVGCV